MRRIVTSFVVIIALALLASARGGSSGGGASSQDPFAGHWKQESGAMSFTATSTGGGSYSVVWHNADGSSLTIDVHSIGAAWGTDDGSWSFEPLRAGEMTVLYPMKNGLMGQVAFTR